MAEIQARLFRLSPPFTARVSAVAEMALVCHRRICTDDAKPCWVCRKATGAAARVWRYAAITAPGWVSTALDMILTGKQLRPKQALRVGLVDEVVPHAILLEAAVELAIKGRSAQRNLPVRERILAGPFGARCCFLHGQ